MAYSTIIFILAYVSMPPAQSLRSGGSSEAIRIHYHPYHAAIEWNNTFRCTGAIVSRLFVLTVENCAPRELTSHLSRLRIRVGATYRGDKRGKVHEVSGYYAARNHSNDDFFKTHVKNYPYFNDLVILRVSQPFSYSSTTKPAVINSKYSEIQDGMYVMVSGWGHEPTKYCESSLRHAMARLIDPSLCKLKDLQSHEICTDYDNVDEEDAYESDVGDLMTSMQGELIGIVTNDRCCEKTLQPVVYSNVSVFYHSKGKEFIMQSDLEAKNYYKYQPENEDAENDVWEQSEFVTHPHRGDIGPHFEHDKWVDH